MNVLVSIQNQPSVLRLCFSLLRIWDGVGLVNLRLPEHKRTWTWQIEANHLTFCSSQTMGFTTTNLPCSLWKHRSSFKCTASFKRAKQRHSVLCGRQPQVQMRTTISRDPTTLHRNRWLANYTPTSALAEKEKCESFLSNIHTCPEPEQRVCRSIHSGFPVVDANIRPRQIYPQAGLPIKILLSFSFAESLQHNPGFLHISDLAKIFGVELRQDFGPAKKLFLIPSVYRHSLMGRQEFLPYLMTRGTLVDL